MGTKYNTLLVGLSILALLVCGLASLLFIKTWTTTLPIISPCSDSRGNTYSVPPYPDSYFDCVEGKAKLFLTVDYAEAKDASKAFLTLLTAILVASITFSEKIVDVTKSTRKVRAVMILSWVLLLLAIASCGAALALMMKAAGYASYFPHLDFRYLEHRAIYLYVFSGLAFGSALAALLIAGVISMAARQTSLDQGAPPPT